VVALASVTTAARYGIRAHRAKPATRMTDAGVGVGRPDEAGRS